MGIRRMCEGGVEGGIWERGLGDRDIGLRCGGGRRREEET